MAFTTLALVLFLVLGFLPVTGDVHSLYYLYSIQSKDSDSNIYDCTAVTLLDDRQIDFYNSADESRTPKQTWLKVSESDSKIRNEKLDFDRQWLNKLIDMQINEFGHTESDGHVLQWRHGCEGERRSDGSVTVLNSINEFGYDGEDLIQFNCNSKTWLTPEKKKNREREEKWSKLYDAVKKCEQCEEMLKIFLKYRTTDTTPSHSPPAVHIFDNESVRESSKLTLTCLATGFYPKDMEMRMRKFRTSIPEHMLISSGVRPNDDGTYQLRKSVEIPKDDSADYYCYASHSSLTEPVIKQWERKVSEGNIIGVCIGAVVTVLILGAVIVCVLINRRRMCRPIPNNGGYSGEKNPGVLSLPSSGGAPVGPGIVRLPSYEDVSKGGGGPGFSRPPSYKEICTGGRIDGVSRPPSYKDVSTDNEDVNEAVDYDPSASHPEDSL